MQVEGRGMDQRDSSRGTCRGRQQEEQWRREDCSRGRRRAGDGLGVGGEGPMRARETEAAERHCSMLTGRLTAIMRASVLLLAGAMRKRLAPQQFQHADANALPCVGAYAHARTLVRA
eukprot:13282903-Alexandrium_andersonii.AAC.1